MSTARNVNSGVRWSDAWLEALAQFSHPGRMRRGQRFAEHGRIQKFEVQPGLISAVVKEGSSAYQLRIQMRVLDDATWNAIIQRLASQALYSARLLEGEMPPDVIEVFESLGAPLFPSADELQASCTCPDWEVPCKHIAALYYLLADRFDDDPFLLFLVRGRSKEQTLSALRELRQSQTDTGVVDQDSQSTSPPLETTIDHFWDIGPSISQLAYNFSPPLTTAPQLRRLGPLPSSQIDMISLLSPIYETVTQRALAWAYQEDGYPQ
ncbi:MAG: SWIM zinc finger family protein [Caldilineales bacterium]|nr:SWIM zinc finger family protein [Caldilineales bacterium]